MKHDSFLKRAAVAAFGAAALTAGATATVRFSTTRWSWTVRRASSRSSGSPKAATSR